MQQPLRGVEIFLLAFLFRLQAFIVSPGSHPVTLFRVDVLNVMGPAMVVAGLLWAAASQTWTRVATLCDRRFSDGVGDADRSRVGVG